MNRVESSHFLEVVRYSLPLLQDILFVHLAAVQVGHLLVQLGLVVVQVLHPALFLLLFSREARVQIHAISVMHVCVLLLPYARGLPFFHLPPLHGKVPRPVPRLVCNGAGLDRVPRRPRQRLYGLAPWDARGLRFGRTVTRARLPLIGRLGRADAITHRRQPVGALLGQRLEQRSRQVGGKAHAHRRAPHHNLTFQRLLMHAGLLLQRLGHGLLGLQNLSLHERHVICAALC
mmetsp:Transcript_35004/g.66873  ORF Transcript_35004/g.66873 Transcript_35004/m.66873 type:complete len:232 (-) Transcript_35004:575-1270(-)